MAKGKKRRKMPMWRRVVRAAIGLVGSAVGVIVGTSPTHAGLQLIARGDFAGGAATVAFETSGVDPRNPATQVDIGKVIRTGVVAGVGIGIILLFRALARRV